MSDATEFVTDDGLVSVGIRGDGQNHFITGNDLRIDIDRLQGKSMLPIHRGNVQSVGLPFLELEQRPPLPEPANQVNITARGRTNHRHVLIDLGPHGVLVNHGLRLGHECLGRRSVGLVGKILLSVNMPDRHHDEHDEGPDQRQRYPGALDPVQWLMPPDSLRRWLNGSHDFTYLLSLSGCERNGDKFHNSPDDVKNGGKNHTDKQEEKGIVDNALHDGNTHIFFRIADVLVHNFVSI